MPQVQAYLSRQLRPAGRLGLDGDDNVGEPTGVIDHFQIVHTRGDEAAGDPNQGTEHHVEPPLSREPPGRRGPIGAGGRASAPTAAS